MVALGVKIHTDEEIMAGLALGETDFLGELYLRHGDAVLRFIDSLLVETSLSAAEDLCQEVFMTIHKKAAGYRETGKLKSWIFGIAARKTRAWQRKVWLRRTLLRRHHKEADGMDTMVKGPHDALEAREDITRTLRKLTKGQREVLLLRAIQGMSGEEISETLSISLDAVWSRLKRAHQEIRNAGVMDAVPEMKSNGS